MALFEKSTTAAEQFHKNARFPANSAKRAKIHAGFKYYKIPRFQRPYSWDHVNVEEFWNDAVVESEGDYFIGNFVVYDDKGIQGVVDGQQRLTTITLLLCALRDVFHEQGEEKLALGLHSLIERPNIKAEKYYVVQSETSYPYFQEHIQKFL